MSSKFQLNQIKENQMDFNEFRNSTYLTQRDIENLPAKDRLVTVDRVEAERVGEEKDLRLVTYFVTLDKGLVTNITNSQILAEISSSPDTDNWPGTDVEIYVNPDIGFGGKRTGGIRLRPLRTKEPQSVEEEYDEMAFGDEEVA